MSDQSRREFLGTLSAAAIVPSLLRSPLAATRPDGPQRAVPVRTITAFVALERVTDRAAIEQTLARLARARRRFEDEGYAVQTTRLVLPPILAKLDARARRGALAELRAIDALCTSRRTLLGLGPVLVEDRPDAELAPWSADLVASTKSTSFSAVIASPSGGSTRTACASLPR